MACCYQFHHRTVHTVLVLGDTLLLIKYIPNFNSSTGVCLMRHIQYRVVVLVFLLT